MRFAIVDHNDEIILSYDGGPELRAELARAVSSQYSLLGLRKKKREQLEAEVNDLYGRLLKDLGLGVLRM